MIAIVDYGAGNIRSVEKAFRFISEETTVTSDEKTILSAEKVVLPGVGAFGDAMQKLNESGLTGTIKKVVEKGTPFFGICLGLQLLFEGSDEAPGVPGLGLIKGYIHRFPDTPGFKIPEIGWNSLKITPGTKLFKGIEDGAFVYFVHSYYLNTPEPVVAAKCNYILDFHAAVEKDNIFACQFHPEKSGAVGLEILKNFAAV